VRVMQCTQFRAKSAKNNLKPMDFLKRNFHFETEEYKLHLMDDKNVQWLANWKVKMEYTCNKYIIIS
jgi:hypothetical protein